METSFKHIKVKRGICQLENWDWRKGGVTTKQTYFLAGQKELSLTIFKQCETIMVETWENQWDPETFCKILESKQILVKPM